MLKIIYFDEFSATDYIDISDGGKKQYSSQKIKDRASKFNANVGAKLEAKWNWLPFFGVQGNSEMKADLSATGNTLIKTTISNTVLTDYLEKVDEDNSIVKFNNYKLSAYPNSMTFIKMYTPYMIIAEKNEELNLSKLDEALASGRGYYELIAESANDRCILRFNIKAFRNNYGISDLIKMKLTYHAIEVGEFEEYKLDMQHEFSMQQKTLSASDILDNSDSNCERSNNNLLKVYDVILAGVENG